LGHRKFMHNVIIALRKFAPSLPLSHNWRVNIEKHEKP
jgi:hypothetical protein